MKVKYRVRWDPKYRWFVIERKDWLLKWAWVATVDTQEKAIAIAKGLEKPLIVWESKDD
jgi:hypothetical protein